MKYPFKLTTHKYQITVFINLKKKKKITFLLKINVTVFSQKNFSESYMCL